jgi:Cu/Ag efflux protein CusF
MFLAHILANVFIFKCIKYTCFTLVFKLEIQAHVAQNKEQEDISFSFEQHL